MNKNHFALIAVLLLGAVRLNAAGAEPPPPPPETPPAKESAKDGAARAEHHHRFGLLKEMDSNHDGKVTKEEFLARASERAAERFDRMDANHDGSIDRTEAAELVKRLRDHMQNRSGTAPRRRPGSAAKTSA